MVVVELVYVELVDVELVYVELVYVEFGYVVMLDIFDRLIPATHAQIVTLFLANTREHMFCH